MICYGRLGKKRSKEAKSKADQIKQKFEKMGQRQSKTKNDRSNLPASMLIEEATGLSTVQNSEAGNSSKRPSMLVDGFEDRSAAPKRYKTSAQASFTMENEHKSKNTIANLAQEEDEILTITRNSGFTTVTDSAGIVRLTNDVSSIRNTLSNQFYIAIPTEDIKFRRDRSRDRERKIVKFFEAYSPTGVHASLTEWLITFGQDEIGAVACFEHFMVEKFKGNDFRMELVGRDGEILWKCKKKVLEYEDDFDREWVGFELLRRLKAYDVD